MRGNEREYPLSPDLLRVMGRAREAAHHMGEKYLSTEHILTGLTCDSLPCTVRFWRLLGLNGAQVQEVFQRPSYRSEENFPPDKMPFTPRASQMLLLAWSEAQAMGATSLDIQHLTLGMLREERGLAGRVLRDLGVTLETARAVALSLTKEQQE
jgi:ATP-dependent Clp protease ATP-binding subunit ClpC